MNLKDVEAFVSVAETGSISRAAARLHLTQPALTRRVQNLELRLGKPLLDRSTKPPGLTASGRRVLDAARRALRSFAELEASCADGGCFSGPLRLGVAQGIVEFALAEPLDELRRAYPKLDLVVRTAWTSALLRELEGGSLDGVIGFFPSDSPYLSGRARTLAQEDVVVVGPHDWPGSAQGSVADFRDVPWVLNPPGCTYRTALEAAFDRHGCALNVAIEVIGRELQLSLVNRGAGFGLCPSRVLRSRSGRHSVRSMKLEDLRIRVDIALLRSARFDDFSEPFATLAEGVATALAQDYGVA